MYIFILALVILIVSLFILIREPEWADSYIGSSIVGTVVAGMTVILMSIALISSKCNVSNDVNQLLIVKQEIEKARSNPNMEAERVAFLPKVIEYNQQIASNRYWNNTQWDLWIPDELANLEPIK